VTDKVMRDALESRVLSCVQRAKRLSASGLSVTEISRRMRQYPPAIRRYLAWPECAQCGTVLRERSDSGLCGLCLLEGP
jgi:hypothetical protein